MDGRIALKNRDGKVRFGVMIYTYIVPSEYIDK